MPYIDYQRITPEGYIRVVNSADYDPIISYTPLPDITVFVDAVVNLPNTVQATFKSGKTETMIIKWERVNVDTSTAGTQKIYGDIGNGAAAVLQNVIVEENLTDLDILRQIRDANPTSQLPALWDDAQDPYTEWEWVTWNEQKTKVIDIDISSTNTVDLSLVYRLTALETLYCNNNKLTSLDIHGLNLKTLNCSFNDLTSISTLTSKGLITQFGCTYNYLPIEETDRIIDLGFPTNEVLPQKGDLDILRQIRDSNPTSELPSLWLDSEDPYTQWEGVTWNVEKTRVITLDVSGCDIITVNNVNKLTALTYLDCNTNQLIDLNTNGLSLLTFLDCAGNNITTLNISLVENLTVLNLQYNKLMSIPSLMLKGNIDQYNFIYNNFPTTELDRFRVLGFTDESKLLPQNP